MKVVESFNSDKAFHFIRGRVALYAIMKSMGIGEGDEVLLQAFTCLAVPLPIINIGAKPVYVDIEEQTFNMNPDLIEEKITEKTKAIIVQHTFGIPANLNPIMAIAKKHNLYVIEDCCHAIGATYDGKEVGTFGDAAFYSFEWGKPIILGVGGISIINNETLKERMKEIYATFSKPSFKKLIVIEMEYLVHHLLAFNILFWFFKDLYAFLSKIGLIVGTFTKEEFEGLLSDDYSKTMFPKHKKRLLRKMSKFNKEYESKNRIVNSVEDEVNSRDIKKIEIDDNVKPAFLKYPFVFSNKAEIMKKARSKYIELSDIFRTPIHPLKDEELELVKYYDNQCPVAEKVANSVVSITIKPRLGAKYIKRTLSFLKKYGIQ